MLPSHAGAHADAGQALDDALTDQGRPNHADAAPTRPSAMRHLKFFVPVLVLLGLLAVFTFGLGRDPREIPSALIGNPVPEFSLPPVQGRVLGLSSTDLVGEVSLVNVFASWCMACRYEHPLFMRLKTEGSVPIHGLNYKDAPQNAADWLDELDDPYTRTGVDRDGRVAIDWGPHGVPEIFVVDREGRIAYKQIGGLTQRDLGRTILPLIAELRR